MNAPDLAPEAGIFTRLRASLAGRIGLKLLQWGIPLLLLALIGRRLGQLGWHEIWAARPANPGFYLLLVLQFFLQPFSDYLVYRNLWRENRPPLAVILRKRLMNTFMLDYSGEAFFFFWAQRHLKLQRALLVHAIKDSNILSGAASLVMVYILLLLLVGFGGLHVPGNLAHLGGQAWLFVGAGTVPLILAAAILLGHRKLTALSRRQMAATFAIHFTRVIAVLAAEFGLWELSGALPSAIVCLQFVALRLVVTRLPLIPNKDLIFVGAGIATAGLAKMAVTPVATVLVILAAADLILAGSVAAITWLLARNEWQAR
jgi:hypothetical protein